MHPAPQTGVQPNDSALVRQFLAGDERACRIIYQRYASHLSGVVFRMMGHDQALDDIVQETFVTAFDKLAQLKNPEHLRLWLVKIAVSLVRACLNRRSYRNMLVDKSGVHALFESETVQRHDLADIYAALDGLSVRLRLPWTLAHVEGLSIDEVAEVCGKSPATVKRWIKSASEKLQRRLAP